MPSRLQLRLQRGGRHRRERSRPPRHGVVQPRGRGARVHLRRHEGVVGQDRELPGVVRHRPRRLRDGHPATPLPVLVRGDGPGQAGCRHGAGHVHAQGARPGIPPAGCRHQGRHRHVLRRHRRRGGQRGRKRAPRCRRRSWSTARAAASRRATRNGGAGRGRGRGPGGRGAFGAGRRVRRPGRARGVEGLQCRRARGLGRFRAARDGGRRTHAHVLLQRHVRQSEDGAARFRLCARAPGHGQALARRAPRRHPLHHRRHGLGQGRVGQVLRPVAHGGVRVHVRLRPLPPIGDTFAHRALPHHDAVLPARRCTAS